MLRCFLFFVLLGAGALAPAQAAGSLIWETTTIVLTPKSTESEATAEFKFQNAGDQAIVIGEVHPDCSCVTAPLKKTRYESGERGQVTARFAVGHQTGDHTITVEVKARAGEAPLSTVLVLHVKIIDVVVFSSRFLYWKPDEPLTPKSVTVTVLPGEPLIVREVRAANPHFTVLLSPTDDPRRFTLLITPPKERARSICPIAVITESTDHHQTQEHSMVARLL